MTLGEGLEQATGEVKRIRNSLPSSDSMKPEDFRKIQIEPGRLLGLIGDYNEESVWTHDEQVQVTLKRYVIAERRHAMGMEAKGILWDAAAIASFPASFETISIEPEGEKLVIHELLLFLRLANESWDEGCHAFVYGIKPPETLEDGPYLLKDWEPKVAWLSAAATLTLEDVPNLSDYSRAIHRRDEWKKLKQMLEAGLITAHEYEIKRADVEKRFPY